MLKYVGEKSKKEFANDLKTIYQAPSEDAALEQLDHGSAVVAHRTGDGDLVALGGLVKLDRHILHVKAAVGQLEAGAKQL